MKNEKFLSTFNTINIKNKHQNPLYLTWNKFRKNNSLSQSNKNINLNNEKQIYEELLLIKKYLEQKIIQKKIQT